MNDSLEKLNNLIEVAEADIEAIDSDILEPTEEELRDNLKYIVEAADQVKSELEDLGETTDE